MFRWRSGGDFKATVPMLSQGVALQSPPLYLVNASTDAR
jgi:hypothetical protein